MEGGPGHWQDPAMRGLMQDRPLTIPSLLTRVERNFGHKRVITGGVIVTAAVLDAWRAGGARGMMTLLRRLWRRPSSD